MEGKTAVDHEGFDPVTYLENFYSPEKADLERKDSIVPWTMACLQKAFSEDDVGGQLLVDIGSGPTLYQVMSGCEVFNKVILTDLMEANRRELKLWLKGEGGSKMDWTPFLQHACKLEGRRPSEWTEKAAKLRQAVTDILHIDVHLPQPLALDALPSAGADCLVSCFCLEAASPDHAVFTRALGHIGTLLRSGGHLLLLVVLGETYYMAGPEVNIPVLPLSEAQICDSLKESGYTLIRQEVYKLPPDIKLESDNLTGVFFAKAKRN